MLLGNKGPASTVCVCDQRFSISKSDQLFPEFGLGESESYIPKQNLMDKLLSTS